MRHMQMTRASIALAAIMCVAVLLAALWRPVPVLEEETAQAGPGVTLFAEYCAFCHATASQEWKNGPSLAGLSQRGTLPSSGKPVSGESLLGQLNAPFETMPSFAHLPEAEKAALVDYLQTL
jgi:mono/diheme cytochrome c family protein